jgi:hypothetical protein
VIGPTRPGECWATGLPCAGRIRPQAPEERVRVLAAKRTRGTLRFDGGLRSKREAGLSVLDAGRFSVAEEGEVEGSGAGAVHFQ